MKLPSTEHDFVTVTNVATLTSFTVNNALTVMTAMQSQQGVQNDAITTTQVDIGNNGTLSVAAGPVLTIDNFSALVCAGDTRIGGTLAPANGVTTAAFFPDRSLMFTNGILTSQRGPPTIMSVNTTNISDGSSNDFSFALPLLPTGTYDFTIAWGDGSSSTITAYNQPETTHTYAVAGVYTLRFGGTLIGWSFNNGGDILKLIDISAWGDMVLGTNEGGYFYGCVNLDISATTGSPLRSTTTSLSRCFSDCASLVDAALNIGTWDVSNITDMSYVFANCSLLNVDLSAWVPSSATTMGNMFNGASVFNNGDPGNNGALPLAWTTSAALTDCSYMFAAASAFNQAVDFSDTSGVTTMSDMFSAATVYNNGQPADLGTAPLSWTTTSLADATRMFNNATAFNQAINFTSYASLNSTQLMFSQAVAFNNGNVGDLGTAPIAWTGAAPTVANYMFNGASSFNQTFQLDTSRVVDLSDLFAGATRFNNGDIVNGGNKAFTINTSSATTIQYMFQSCSVFNQQVTFTGSTASVTLWLSLFQYCRLFNNGVVGNLGTAPLVFDTSSALTFEFMFGVCVSFNQQLVFTDTSKVTSMFAMFAGCSLFNNGQTINSNTAPITFNTSSVTNMSNMFNNNVNFNQALAFTDTSKVINMGNMLNGCVLFKQDLSAWNVTACTNFFSFYNQDLNAPDSGTNQDNYNALLVSWGGQIVYPGLTLNIGFTRYSGALAIAAHTTLTTTFGWTITDGGPI